MYSSGSTSVTRWTSRRQEKLSGSEPRASRRLDLGQLAKCDTLLVSDSPLTLPPPSPRHSRLDKRHRQCQEKPRAAGRSALTCFGGKDELPEIGKLVDTNFFLWKRTSGIPPKFSPIYLNKSCTKHTHLFQTDLDAQTKQVT